MHRTDTAIQFKVTYDLGAIAREWQELESLVHPSFFLSWAWIGCWLEQTGIRPILVRAKRGAQTLALGFLTPHRARRHLMNIRQLCLNETGVGEHDRLMIEHNGFLMMGEGQDGLLTQIFLAAQNEPALGSWDELVLSGVSQELMVSAGKAGLAIELDRMSPDFCVDLKAARQSGALEKEFLSPGLRAQIRQSRSFAERIGPVVLTAARTDVEALEYFEEMVRLHTVYWRSRGKPGAFASEYSVAFHRALISASARLSHVELLRLSAGDQILGYLYNFLYSGTISNYQSGFSYIGNNRHRPGLLAHAMAIERAAAAGWKRYDFLAGDSGYKSRFGENAGSLNWCRAQRRRPGLMIERAVRRAMGSLAREKGSADRNNSPA